MGRNWKQAPTEQGQYYLTRRAPAWMSLGTSAIALPPLHLRASELCTHPLLRMDRSTQEWQIGLSTFAVFFPQSPAILLDGKRWSSRGVESFLISAGKSQAPCHSALIKCVHEHTVLLWVPLYECLFIFSPGLSDGHLVLFWSLTHLPQRFGKWASFRSLKTVFLWLKHEWEITLFYPVDPDQWVNQPSFPRDLELRCLLSHLQSSPPPFFFQAMGTVKTSVS